ncbi:putative transmembrane anti-sigma factor [Pandoraea anhela]|uniref:Putative transmembrane anti-sigma factor n=2 Tax=Pandoraea anhela TaxID=2508295 RepID=A0A5E4WJ54_9BURK|nr:putative transmembrane anti-sigma factor [Pandoraea anhela]
MMITDQTLLSYVDGTLSDEVHAKVEAAVSRSPALAARVAALRASDLPFREAYDDCVSAPVPPELISTLRTLVRGRTTLDVPSHVASANDARFARARHRVHVRSRSAVPRRSSLDRDKDERGATVTRRRPSSIWWQIGGFSAGAMAFVVLVASAGARFLTEGPAPTPLPLARAVVAAGNLDVDSVAAAPPEAPNVWHGSYEPWVRAFVSYQTLIARATLDPLDDEPAEAIATVRAIRHRDDIPLVVPDLRRANMEFKRVQRLQFDGRAVVQIAYLPREGPPVALYIVKDTRLAHGPSAQVIPPMDTVTWRRDGQMFALVAPSGSSDLLPIARALANAVVPVLYDGGATPPSLQANGILQPFTDAMADSPLSQTYESR